MNDPKTVEAVQWLQDQFCNAKTVNPGAVSNDTTVTHEVFEKGQGGIYLVGPYVLARFVDSIGTDKIEVFPVPKGPSGGPGTLGEGENVYLMAGSQNEDGQKKFAEFAISAEGQRIGMNKDANGAIVRLPVNTEVDLAAERQDPRWKVFQDAYANAVYAPPVPNWAPIRQSSADAHQRRLGRLRARTSRPRWTPLNTKLTQELQNQKGIMTPTLTRAKSRTAASRPAPRNGALAGAADRLGLSGARSAAVPLLQVHPHVRGPADELLRRSAYIGDQWVGFDNYATILTDDAFVHGHLAQRGAGPGHHASGSLCWASVSRCSSRVRPGTCGSSGPRPSCRS